MCGIFGLIRNEQAPHPERASAVFVELGRHAIERGRDSAGFALHNWDPAREGKSATTATMRHVSANETLIDGVLIVKDTVTFDDLWDDDQHLPFLAAHRVALGHTRWATQGKRDSLTNASPLAVGSLVGSHNGDIDTYSVRGKWTLGNRHGTTDTEVLYQALDRDRRDRRKITETLRTIEGRAALAWLDRARPDRVYLARAALSPLALAWDAEGNMYWASNPRWFRDIETKFNGAIGFHTITLVEEGALLTVSLRDAAPVVEDLRRFTPVCRASDARLGDGVVWRGFDPSDCAADKAQKRHKVAARASQWGHGYGKGKSKSTTRKSGLGNGYSGWDMSRPGFLPATPTASTSEGTLPDYFDRLDGVASREFTHSDAAEAQQESLWEDETELLAVDEGEAMRAATRWVEEGADQAVLGVLRAASMPSEVEDLMEEFDLSSVGSFYRFRDIINSWDSEAAALG